MGDQPTARPLLTHRTAQTQNKRIYIDPCLEWDSNLGPQKTVHASDRSNQVSLRDWLLQRPDLQTVSQIPSLKSSPQSRGV
jgi:hypothetical protein